MGNKNNFWGFFFVVIGVLLLISKVFNIQLFGMNRLWPLLVIILGLCFNLMYFSGKAGPGILVPGGILTTIGILFLFETMTNWHFSGYTWPIYPFSVAIGLSELYIFGGRKRELRIPIAVLCIISIISFSNMLFGNVFRWINKSFLAPIIIIIIGLVFIFGKGNKNTK